MEEDIKILEDFKNITFLYGKLAITQEAHKSVSIALENLIKGYRDLEKDLHEMTISNNHKKENWIHKNCLNDYIPKSKIKEKIEEVKMTSSQINGDYFMNNYKIQVLQELMEDK